MAKKNRPLDDFMVSAIVFLAIVGVAAFVFWPRENTIEMTKTGETSAAVDAPEPRERVKASEPESSTSGSTVKTTPGSSMADATKVPPPPQAAPAPAPAPQAPTTGEASVDSALKAVDEGRWQEAEEMFKKILERDPQNETALNEMAMIHLIDKKDPEGAIPFLKQSLEVNAENPTMVSELVNAAKLTGTVNETIDFLQSIDQGASGPVSYGIAEAYRSIGESDKAIPYLDKSLKAGGVPTENVLEERADSKFSSGDYEGGLKDLEDATRSLEQKAQQHNADPETKRHAMLLKARLADTYINAGQPEKARQMIEELEQQDPNNEYVQGLKNSLNQGNGQMR